MAALAHHSQFQVADTLWATFLHQDGKVHATIYSPSAGLLVHITHGTDKMLTIQTIHNIYPIIT